jgi:putative component of toxin-antitoxin plasmid stabilization module
MAGIKEKHREAIHYGLLILKILSDFNVTFVKVLSDTIYELRTWDQGYVYLTYFYLNGDTIVLMDCHLDEVYKHHKAADRGLLRRCKEMRWNHVLWKCKSEDYDAVLDAQFGEPGSIRREVSEMRACSSYVSQAIRFARVSAELNMEDVGQRLGLNYKVTRLTHVEDGFKVIPYKYLTRILNAIGFKAILTRPGLPGWNEYSRSHTLEQMLLEIGEPVYRWHPKEEVSTP